MHPSQQHSSPKTRRRSNKHRSIKEQMDELPIASFLSCYCCSCLFCVLCLRYILVCVGVVFFSLLVQLPDLLHLDISIHTYDNYYSPFRFRFRDKRREEKREGEQRGWTNHNNDTRHNASKQALYTVQYSTMIIPILYSYL